MNSETFWINSARTQRLDWEHKNALRAIMSFSAIFNTFCLEVGNSWERHNGLYRPKYSTIQWYDLSSHSPQSIHPSKFPNFQLFLSKFRSEVERKYVYTLALLKWLKCNRFRSSLFCSTQKWSAWKQTKFVCLLKHISASNLKLFTSILHLKITALIVIS